MRPRGRTAFLAAAVLQLLLAARLASASATNSTENLVPHLPMMRSPVDLFRNLLAESPAERRQSLTNRPPEVRSRILAKLREYESLKPDERELRLRATELQWYLQPFMSDPKSDREARLALIPEDMRKLVAGRLAKWDLLPPEIQAEMVDNEMTSRYFTQLQAATEEQRKLILARMSPERRAKLEAGLDRWRRLSPEQRDATLQGFNAFFELTPEEKEKTLNTLSEAEQRQMEKTLEAYANLPVSQRVQCIRSFEKFTRMTLAERQEFLKNAERWKLMTPAERESWRTLVRFAPLQPPMPSPVRLPLARPPAPPPLHNQSAGTMATNGN